jgi:hypothetical protein
VKKSALFLFLFFALTIKAQHPYYYSLNDENGLPSNEVYQIVQDDKGFVWIGCDAGLYRYNGFEFKAYKNSGQNSRSISNLTFDAENNLWCKNFSGQIFRVYNDSLLLVADYSSEANKYQIGFYNKPGFWKINKDALSLHDIDGKLIKKYPLNFEEEIYGAGVSIVYFNNILWIEIPGKGLHYLDKKSLQLTLVFSLEKGVSYQNQHLFTINEELFLIRSESSPSVYNFIYKINTDTKTTSLIYEFYNFNQIRNYYFYQDSQKNLWIGSSFGAICIPNIYRFTEPKMICFKNHKISSILQDKEGNYWFSDLQNGIHVIPEMESIIQNSVSQKPIAKDICSIHPMNDSTLLMGYYNGEVYIYDIKQKTNSPVKEINAVKGITVKDILQYKNKWYISRGHLMVYDYVTKESFFPAIYGNARDLLLYNDTVYGVHPEYLSRFSIKELQKNKPLNFEKFYKTGGRKVEKEPNSNLLYFALNNGLVTYKNGKFSPVLFNGQEIFTYTFASNNSSVWAGTNAQGIIELRNGVVIRSFLKEGDLEDITVKVMYADSNFIWAFTNSDFIRITIADGAILKYSRNIGINPKDVTSIVKSGNNLHIGTKKALIKIPADLKPNNPFKPTICFENICFNDSVIVSPNSELPYNFSNLKFEFISFSYRSKKDLVYEYRMQGFDSVWTKTAYNNPNAVYSSLPSGSYIFEVKSINESGIESDVLSYSFYVATPLWQKGWFYFITSLCSIIAVVMIARYQVNMIKKRNEAEKKMIQSQLTALKAQMNPHFMYNALNSIQALILKQDIKNSNLYLSKFSNLMRKVLDASGRDEINLQEEIEILELYLSLEKLRFGNDFKYEIYIADKIDMYGTLLPPLLLQPFVENAIKHGLLHKKGEKQLSIGFYMQANTIMCSIKDNGVGREYALEIKERFKEKHSSFSTGANEKRIELLNSFIKSSFEIEIIDLYENNKPSGTEVLIKIKS